MRAVITGATSGIGRDMAILLAKNGWDLILTGRNEKELAFLKAKLPTKIETIALDLTEENAPFQLYRFCQGKRVDLLVNNAGFGDYGPFCKSKLKKELDMISVNVCAVHVLTKLFLRDFRKRNHGQILNVASIAGLMTGPLMSTYYASKNYVVRLSLAIAEELRRENSRVTISVLCPGPVATRFNERAGANFRPSHMKSCDVARYALEQTFAGKRLIIPGVMMKLSAAVTRLVPHTVLPVFLYEIQSRRGRK
ncbi:MAG: SDR family oxidoreductase [Ruminococcus sp.]|nr:SDR family oxidoreductase [Ruminococcus sp.]